MQSKVVTMLVLLTLKKKENLAPSVGSISGTKLIRDVPR